MKKLSDSSGRIYAGESMADRQAKRHLKFLQAGYELFGTIGFRQTTVRALCKEAQLTDRYFYESFENIEQLLIEVYLQQINDIRIKILEAINLLDNRHIDKIIECALDTFFRVVESPKTARIIWFEVLGVSPQVDEVYHTATVDFSKLFIDLSVSVYPQIDIPQEEIEVLAIGMIGAISHATLDWLFNEYRTDRAVMVRSMSYIVKGVANILTHSQSN